MRLKEIYFEKCTVLQQLYTLHITVHVHITVISWSVFKEFVLNKNYTILDCFCALLITLCKFYMTISL